MRVFTSRSWPHYCLYWMFLENICINSHAIGLVTHMLDCRDLPIVQDAHQRGFRSGYTECRLIKKWVYAVYLRIPSTTPLRISTKKHCQASMVEGLAPPTRAVGHSHDTICRRLRVLLTLSYFVHLKDCIQPNSSSRKILEQYWKVLH